MVTKLKPDCKHLRAKNTPMFGARNFVNLLKLNASVMTTTAIKKQVEDYHPMLSTKQQALVLEMIKSLIQVDNEPKRMSRKQYNKELNEAVTRIDNGNAVSHKEALKEIAKW